jgi:hypothetical protein
VVLWIHSVNLKQPLWPELEVAAKKMLRKFSVSWTKLFTKITWMLVGYLIWMNLPFRLSKNGVGSVGVTTAEVFGGKRLTQAVLSGRGVCRVGKKKMSARNLHFFYFIYF